MNTGTVLLAMLKADFSERTRRSSFLVTLCGVIALGYAVNAGQVLIRLGDYRGIYNSAWVGSLMALVITFLLGLGGFFLVKNTVERDERSGVGQILATTPLTRAQYLLGKGLSNFAVLSTLVVILAAAAVFMQLIQREDAQVQLWPLIAPFLFIALPMMALVAAFAVFFESVRWLRGGFGNIVYFFLFIFLLLAGIQLAQYPWLDVIGINLVGSQMRAAARAAFPNYDGTFVLSMISAAKLDTFVWKGMDWTAGLIFQRLAWVVVSMLVALSGALFFDRFDSTARTRSRGKQAAVSEEDGLSQTEAAPDGGEFKAARLTLLALKRRFHSNFLRLAWLEVLLLVKGLKWYGWAAMGALWIGCAAAPSASIRGLCFMLAAVWPVLVWSKMGERETRFQTGQLIFQAPYPLLRPLFSSWLAGAVITGVALGGALAGRLIFAEPVGLLSWLLSVLFIPALAITLGVWSRGSKAFEVIYPILWYLGPFNPQNQLALIDYLGVHSQAPANTSPEWFAGVIALLLALALIGRARGANA